MKKILYIDFWPTINNLNISGHGLGASFFKLTAMLDSLNMGYDVELLTTAAKKDLLEGSLEKIHTSAAAIDLSSYHKVIFLGIMREDLKHFQHNDYHAFSAVDRNLYKNMPHIEFWRRYNSQCLNEEYLEIPCSMKLCIRDHEKIKAQEKLQRSGKWVALSTQVISALKEYKRWGEVISLLLDKDLNILLLGNERQSYEEHPRLLNLTGQTDIHSLKALISEVDVYVGNDGFIANLALFQAVPAVVLFSMIAPKAVIDPGQEKRSPVTAFVQKGCPHQFCYSKISNYRTAKCLNNIDKSDSNSAIACLEFDPESIFEEILKIINHTQ